MKTNQDGIDLIKRYEELKLKAYICPAGKLTIGYGHTGSDVSLGQVITEEQAEEILCKDLEKSEAAVSRLVTVPLNENQFSALVSFVFNCGAYNFEKSSLLSFLNAHQYKTAGEQLMRWNKANVNGQMVALNGLTARRAAEKNLFES